MTNIVGLGGSIHDFSSCLITDSGIVAIEDERLTRVRYAINSKDPCKPSLKYCLQWAGISYEDIDVIVGNDELLQSINFTDYPNIKFINHHLSHAYSTFFTSPFDEAAILVVDGAGSRAPQVGKYEARETTTMALGSKNKIRVLGQIFGDLEGYNRATKLETLTSNSLGEFYRAVAHSIGFGWLVGSGKVMGLAPYGAVKNDDRFLPDMLSCVEFLDDGQYRILINGKAGIIEKLYQIQRDYKDKDNFETIAAIAYSGQKVLEMLLIHILDHLWNLVQTPNLCLAGGVALNSLANGKIPTLTNFKNIHVFFAPGDSGTAIGAAIWGSVAQLSNSNNSIRYPLLPYLGMEYSSKQMIDALTSAQLNYTQPSNLEYEVARLLNQGLIVAWYQGGSEFGPRSLGNRSILADVRSASIREHINHNIKNREWFRPLAPVVKQSATNEYFSVLCSSPWMQFVWPVREEYRALIPAITHIDGSARIQSVSKHDNERLYLLLENFEKLTGIPILLNTSFNIKGEPIVETPFDAVSTFQNSSLDVLVLGDFLVVKDKQFSK